MALEIQHLVFEMSGKRELRLVALEDGKIVGVCSVANFDKAAATIFQLFVIEERSGMGIGSELVWKAMVLCDESGAQSIGAIVENEVSAPFWSKKGFKPVHVDGVNILVSRQITKDSLCHK